MCISHCLFIERNLRKNGVLHCILCRYPTMISVFSWGHSWRSMACSCMWMFWGGPFWTLSFLIAKLASTRFVGATPSGREGPRIKADSRFSSGWIQARPKGNVSMVFQSCTVHRPWAHSSCTCPSVNSMGSSSVPGWKGIAGWEFCCVVSFVSSFQIASGLLRKV